MRPRPQELTFWQIIVQSCRMTKRMTKVSKLLLAGLIGGVLAAIAVLPATALATWAVNHAGVPYADLPQALRTPAISQASYLYANDGTTLITTFYDENRRDVPLGQVPKVMQDAVIAAEDARFYDHHGVDVKGIVRALVANSEAGESQQGASTLTMQYVRNVLKSDPSQTEQERLAATEVTPARKIQEARYAITLEEHLTKPQILERYLNIAYFGAGAYGIDAAAQAYFSKEPGELTLAEAATLAGRLQNPEGGDHEVRREYTLTAMANAGLITKAEAEAALAQPIGLRPGVTPNNCTAAAPGWGFFCDYVRQWWEGQPELGSLNTGGYKIVTTLDPGVQATSAAQVASVYGLDSKFVAPIAVVEPGTGKVRAMAVNRTYGETYDQLIAGGSGLHGYQAGSTFKMFAMLAALESGLPLSTSFDAPATLVTDTPQTAPGKNNCDGMWCISNANPSFMDGYRTMWDGFGRSVNTYFVWLHEQIGAEKTVEMAQRLGIQTDDPGTASFVLGVTPAFPLELANAYATVAAEGLYCQPLPVQSITGKDGVAVDVEPTCNQVLSPDVARAATDAARCPGGQQGFFGRCNGGTASAVAGVMDGRPLAGKTGSSDNGRTESFVAFTPELAAAMIAANPDNPEDGVGGAIISKVTKAVATTLATSLQGQPETAFGKPSDRIAFGGRDRLR
jgi:membrane peptidoglycan carboxypeptidase